MRRVVITPAEAGQRLDKYLNKYFNEAPRGFLYKLLRKKRIKLNGSRAQGNEILQDQDVLDFYIAPETQQTMMASRHIKPAGEIDIVYEDENILAVNKPAGLLSHSQSEGDSDTLIDRVLYYLYKGGEFSASADSAFTPALANRLDRNTSGLVLCGKNLPALQELNRCIATGGLDKIYTAVVVGAAPPQQELTGFYEKDTSTNTARILETQAGNKKTVQTSFVRIAAGGGYSLLNVRLLTGKSHQIRAHLASVSHPIAGDKKYGGSVPGITRQLLHAEKIVFNQISGELSYLLNKTISAPWPEDLTAFSSDHFKK